jgi:integrase
MNLKKRHNTFYVRKRVPTSLRALIGKDEVVRTTGTSDEREARRRSYAILAQIEDEFQRAASLAADYPASPTWVQAIGRELRRAVERGELDGETASHLMHDTIEQHFSAAGIDPDAATDLHVATLRASYRMVTHPDDVPLSQAIKLHLQERKGRVAASTLHSKQRALDAFAVWLRADLPLKDITRQQAGSYVTALVREGRAAKTNATVVGVLSAFWNWSIRKGLYVGANPFAGHSVDLKGSRRGTSGGRRRPWTPDELGSMAEGLPATDTRWQACVLGLYTGMRLNEVCHLEVTDVNLEDGYLAVGEGKTESSVRQVPIHPVIKPLLKRLVKASTDGFILPGLVPGGLDDKRGHGLSKRIGRWLRVNLEITDPGVVYHSLRSTFINACENAGIAQHTTELLVGHARQSMSYGVYSKGVALPVLQQAIEKISFGSLDATIQSS